MHKIFGFLLSTLPEKHSAPIRKMFFPGGEIEMIEVWGRLMKGRRGRLLMVNLLKFDDSHDGPQGIWPGILHFETEQTLERCLTGNSTKFST
jgi:hypothetical protein